MNPEQLKAALAAWQQARRLHAAGLLREAEPHYRQALQVLPKTADLLADYGRLAEQLGDWRAAEKIWTRFASIDPTRPSGDRRGLALMMQGRPTEALPFLEAHQQRHPADADSMVNLGACYAALDREDDAARVLRRCIELRPAFQHAWESLAKLRINSNDREGAEDVLARAVKAFPGNRELRYMLMEHKLKSFDYAGGFELFDARWGTEASGENIKLPTEHLWDGKPFEGRLLVRAEQGIGDELVYSSLFGDVLASHADTVIDCDPRLMPLFSRSFPATTFIPRLAPEDDPRRTGYARQCIAGDLCRWFRRSAADFPKTAGWLKVDTARRDALAESYRARHGRALRVGIAWRSKHPFNGVIKSLALDDLLPFLRVPGVQFFNLQYGDTGAEIEALRATHGIDIHVEPTVDPTNDLDGLAAQIAALDLVVSTSNSTVHLAGAIGAPTWVMVHRDRGLPWYWGYEGNSVPWYPKTQLLRCPSRGGWQPVIDEVAARLARRITSVT